jgi:hypothetical protein
VNFPDIVPLDGKFDLRELSPLPVEYSSLPDGWLLDLKCEILYNAALAAEEPIMEVGTWEGRSTCCLAYGKADNNRRPIFDVFDFGDTGLEEFTNRHGSFDPPETERERLLRVVTAHGGVAGCLKQNLADRKLGGLVTGYHFGDITDMAVSRKYDVVFCDVSHGEDEIVRNVGFIKGMMVQSDYLAIFDDAALPNEYALIKDIMNPDRSLCFGIDNGGTWMVSKFSIMAKGRYAEIPWLN